MTTFPYHPTNHQTVKELPNITMCIFTHIHAYACIDFCRHTLSMYRSGVWQEIPVFGAMPYVLSRCVGGLRMDFDDVQHVRVYTLNTKPACALTKYCVFVMRSKRDLKNDMQPHGRQGRVGHCIITTA